MDLKKAFISWCLLLNYLYTVSASHNSCSNDSLVDIQTKSKGEIVFSSTLLNYAGQQCTAEIRSPSNVETELVLMNVWGPVHREELCFNSYIEIRNNNNWYIYCKRMGKTENLTLRSNITIVYTDYFPNEVPFDSDSITVRYNRIESIHSTPSSTQKPCRHVLKKPSDDIQTPGYPDALRGDCEWIISADRGEGISIEFQISGFCRNQNYIEIRQGNSKNGALLKKLNCTRKSKLIFTTLNLWISIKSASAQGIGVRASYKVERCNVITASKQLNFASQTNRLCQSWNLTAPPGQIAALSITDFNKIKTDISSCGYENFLEVWDGKTTIKYCNGKSPPLVITSIGRQLIVTYKAKRNSVDSSNSMNQFHASFTSVNPKSFKTNCFVQDQKLSFKCSNAQVIPCAWQCDGAMQCSDNSDETSSCSKMEANWEKLQVFVIVMGSICASTIIFCIGLICCRKFIINNGSRSSERRRQNINLNDQSSLAQNADLPSPPPCYFTNQNEEEPVGVIRGTYFFGDEFSQSGIHSASLFGIPPPRYSSTESLHQVNSHTRRSLWQRSISSIPLVPTENCRNTEIVALPEEGPPDYDSLRDKDEEITGNTTAHNMDTVLEVNENEHSVNNSNLFLDIGRTNAGATLSV